MDILPSCSRNLIYEAEVDDDGKDCGNKKRG